MFKSIFAVVLLAAFVSANLMPKFNASNPIECTVCEYAVKTLENQLESNGTISGLVDGLEKVCTVVPTSLTQLCDQLIETYAPQIIFALIQKETPEAVCKAIQAC